MKKITKYIVLSIIAVVASSWQCQSRGPKQEYGYYKFKFINKSDSNVRYFIIKRPSFNHPYDVSLTTPKDSITYIIDLSMIFQDLEPMWSYEGTRPDEELSIYLQTEAKKTITSIKVQLPLLPKDVQINKHVHFALQTDYTIKIDIIDVPWDNL